MIFLQKLFPLAIIIVPLLTYCPPTKKTKIPKTSVGIQTQTQQNTVTYPEPMPQQPATSERSDTYNEATACYDAVELCTCMSCSMLCCDCNTIPGLLCWAVCRYYQRK